MTVTSAHGTVAKNPDTATYTYGTVVTLTATASPGWTFASWTGDATGATSPVTVTMNANRAVTANYTQDQYTLTVTSAHGTVAKNPDTATYTYGTVVTLTATASPGWTFASWTGDATGATSPVTVTMNANRSRHRELHPGSIHSTVTSAHGTVAKNLTAMHLRHGGDADRHRQSRLDLRQLDGRRHGATSPVTVTMNANRAVTANYTQDQYDRRPGAHGTVAKNPDTATYTYGTVVTLTATASPGWTFASWTGDATGATSPVTVTMNANRAVTANYTQDQYTLTVTSAHGTVAKNPDTATYTYGTVVTLTATASPGWTFASWTGDATGATSPVTVTMNANRAVTANYTRGSTHLDGDQCPRHGGEEPDTATYTYGTVVTPTATASSGWTFASWTGDARGYQPGHGDHECQSSRHRELHPGSIHLDGDQCPRHGGEEP